ETTLERDTLATRVSALETDLFQRESAVRESEEGRNTLLERAGALAKAYNTKEAEFSQAQEAIKTLTDKLAFIEEQIRTSAQGTEKQIEELHESLRREK